MKTLKRLLIFIFGISMCQITYAQLDVEQLKRELKEVTAKEQQAFKKGDCTKVLDMMEDSITFLANGNRVPSKEVIGKFCNSLPRPFQKPMSDALEFYVLDSTSGYSLRNLVYLNKKGIKIQEYVTKIWRKTDGQWKISHLHSTVKEL